MIINFAVVFLGDKTFDEETPKKIRQHHKVDDLDVEEIARVTIGQDGNSTLCDDDAELSQLQNRYERFDFVGDFANFRILDAGHEVVRVHNYVYEGVDDSDVHCHEFCGNRIEKIFGISFNL